MTQYRFFYKGIKYEGIYVEGYLYTDTISIPFKKAKGRKIIRRTISTSLPDE